MPLRSKFNQAAHAAGKLVRGRKGEPRTAAELVIITGMSGSGKASALKAFEDLGFYCVDNLPVELIPRFAELALHSGEIPRTALVVDVREGWQLEKLPAILKSLKRTIPTKVIYLEASDAALLRRFSETRRPPGRECKPYFGGMERIGS
jgi:RNase adapter protein RapZ